MKGKGTITSFTPIFNQRGFTLLELLLAMTIAGIIFGVATETMMRQADTYSFVANRKSTMADLRHAMKQITYEFMRLGSDDILDISETDIDFIDSEGNTTSFELNTAATGDGSLSLYSGSEEIVQNIQSFELEYQDGSGNVLDADAEQIADVRRIKVTIKTEAVANEGSITLSTLVTPREFIGYNGFQ